MFAWASTRRPGRLPPSFSVRFAAILGVLGLLVSALPLALEANDTRSAAVARATDRAAIVASLVSAERQSLAAYAQGTGIQLAGTLAQPGGSAMIAAVLEADARTNNVLLAFTGGSGTIVADPGHLAGPGPAPTALSQAGRATGGRVMQFAGEAPWVVAAQPLPEPGGTVQTVAAAPDNPGGSAARGTVVVGRPIDARFVSDSTRLAGGGETGVAIIRERTVVTAGTLAGARVGAGTPLPSGASFVVGGENSAGTASLDGHSVALAARALGGGYSAVVSVPVSGILGTVVAAALGPLVLVIAAMVWLVLIVRRDLQLPLHRLDRAVAALAREDFTAPVPTGTDDEVGRLGASFERMRRELRAVIDSTAARAAVASELNAQQPLQTALESVCRHISGALQAGRVMIIVNSPDLADPYCVSVGGPEIDDPIPFLLGDGPIGYAARLGEGRSLLACASALAPEADRGLSEICAAPVRIGSRVLGVLAVADRLDGFRTSDISLIESSAEQIALALERYRFLAVVQQQASTDELTGLHNYRFLVDYLDQQVALAERQETPLAVLMLDIDHFKQFNDRHGHHAGDVALQVFAETVAGGVRRSDLAARYGGEEFTVVMANTHREDALVVAEKIRAAVEAVEIPLESESLRMTVSIGAVAFPEDTGSARELLRLADEALYRAKGAGRNRVCVSDKVDPARVSGRELRRQD